MNNDTDINPMEEKDSKRRVIGLAMIGVVIAGLCALFIMAFLWFQPDQPALFAKYFPSPTPTRTPKPTPTSIFEPITITAQEDFSSNYPYLEELATGWESPLLPSKPIFHVEVNQDQSVAVSRGWCTTTEAILEENLVTTQAREATKSGKRGALPKARRKAARALMPFLRAVER